MGLPDPSHNSVKTPAPGTGLSYLSSTFIGCRGSLSWHDMPCCCVRAGNASLARVQALHPGLPSLRLPMGLACLLVRAGW